MTTSTTLRDVAKAGGNAPATRGGARDIATLLSDPKVKAQMALALPKHVTADRLARIALTECRRVPKLATCDQRSLLGAIMQCAQLGLEPGGALGHCYLLPFDNRKKGITEVQFIIGYRGMIELARRSGQIISLEARAVHEHDTFEVSLGLTPRLHHVPAYDAPDRGRLRFVYAVAQLQGGGVQFDVMSRAEIEKVRALSKSASSGPWVDHFEAMALKTVTRRLFKWLPVSIEIQSATVNDERADAGLSQFNPLTVDAETGEFIDEPADDSGGDAGAGETGNGEPPPAGEVKP